MESKKQKAWGKHQRIDIRRSIRKGGLKGRKKWWWKLERQTHPAQWMGLKAIDKKVGGRKRMKKKSEI